MLGKEHKIKHMYFMKKYGILTNYFLFLLFLQSLNSRSSHFSCPPYGDRCRGIIVQCLEIYLQYPSDICFHSHHQTQTFGHLVYRLRFSISMVTESRRCTVTELQSFIFFQTVLLTQMQGNHCLVLGRQLNNIPKISPRHLHFLHVWICSSWKYKVMF